MFLQYVLGFRKLGWDVLFVDHLQSKVCVDAEGHACQPEHSVNLEYFMRVIREFGLENSFAILTDDGVYGMSRAKLLEKAASTALLINVMGFLRDEEILGCVRKRVFLDIDPGFGQMWQALGLCEMFQGHDSYVTIGENVGRDWCVVPTCGLSWIPSRDRKSTRLNSSH